MNPRKGLAGCGKTLSIIVIPSGARNLALKTTDLRDSSSPAAPRNDRPNGFFRSLLVLDANILMRAVLGRRVRELLETYHDEYKIGTTWAF